MRKWYIQTYLKRMAEAEKQSGEAPTDRPLSKAERFKFTADSRRMQNFPKNS